MSYLSCKIYPEVLRSIDSATLTGIYFALGAPLLHPSRLIKFTNTSNVTVTISWDGINAHEILPAGGFVLLDISANKESSDILEIQEGTQFYVSGPAGTGLIYLSSYFGD
jgi:hypothetical protein